MNNINTRMMANKLKRFLFFILFVNILYFIINTYNDFTLKTLILSVSRQISRGNSLSASTNCSVDLNHKPRVFCIILTKPENFRSKALAAYQTWAHKCDNYRFISVIPDEYKTPPADSNHVLNRVVYFASQQNTGINDKNAIDYHYVESAYNYENSDDESVFEFESLIKNNEKKKRRSKKAHSSRSSSSLELFMLNLNFTILQPAGLHYEMYSKLTDKVYYAVMDIYKRFRNDYDWFLKADDDTFIFMDNLREFLRDKSRCELYKYGYNFQILLKWQCGGAGYLLSQEAFKRVGAKLIENFSYCPNTGIEDKDISRCLRRLNVLSGNSLDELNRERFHHTNIYSNYKGIQDFHIKLFAQNTPKKGLDCCSDSSISFHYESPDEMYKLAAIIEKHDLDTNPDKGKLTFKKIIEELGIE